MNKFLIKCLFFIIPFFIWLIIEGILPITTFTFRHQEASLYKTRIPHRSKYYPNINSSMNAVGDLCAHTNNSIIKKEVWRTDDWGFRNNEFIENPDILIIGDSYVLGCGLSQEETISSKVASKFNYKLKVYNMASSSMREFDKNMKLGIIKKPKLLIYSIVERNIPPIMRSYILKSSKLKENIRSIFEFYNINVFLDKALRMYSLTWLKARINHSKRRSIPAVGNTKMFFLSGINQIHNDEDLLATAKAIISYKKYCDTLGINFLFLPMPNKETVYYELVPFSKQPNYLIELDSILNKSNVFTINTLDIYNDYRKENKSLLYHYDDTHWNSNATEIIANEISTNTQCVKIKAE